MHVLNADSTCSTGKCVACVYLIEAFSMRYFFFALGIHNENIFIWITFNGLRINVNTFEVQM